MPPKSKTQSGSRDVVPVGAKHVFKNSANKKVEGGERPTTTKALVLRNGKHGAMGTGELVLQSRMGGREKLDLLSEDYTKNYYGSAVRNPFKLQQCVKIAESQLNAYLDEISTLQDPSLFYNKIKEEVSARYRPAYSRKPQDPLKDGIFVARVVANHIHNTYMLASGWNLVLETLYELDQVGWDDRLLKAQLRDEETIRSRFLVLVDIVNVLVDAAQVNFALLTTTTPHYADYFKQTDSIDEPEFGFDWGELKKMHKSFLDSIIIELCLPNPPTPKHILFQILHEAVAEAPKEAKRFPQPLWDAVGDFAITVHLQDILEGPLLGPDGEKLQQLARTMPEEYEQWVDAQLFSYRASQKYATYQDAIIPLDKTRTKHVLDTMWKNINLNYKSVSGMDIDTLWNVAEKLERTPQWHSFYIPGLNESSLGSKLKSGKKRLAITSGDPDDSDGSMPSLQTVSDSSEAESDYFSDPSSDDEDDDDDGEESGWDTDEEEDLKHMFREAMAAAVNLQEFTDPKVPLPELDELAEERKGNPFLKLLGSLRGRMFSSNPALKTPGRTQPRRPYADGNAPVPPLSAKASKAKDPSRDDSTKPDLKSQKASVEEVKDEDAISPAKKTKKKKPKKKKRASSTASESTDYIPEPPVSPTRAPSNAAGVPPTSPTKVVPQSPTKKKKTPLSPQKARPMSASSTTSLPRSYDSTTSLPIPVEQTAQSAHAYIQSEGLASQKSKIKSRPDFGNLAPVSESRSFFRGFGRNRGSGADFANSEKTTKGSKHSWFSKLTKKTVSHMRQLIGVDEKVTPMKWENFLKVMREMGFSYDPSTAGSSVRFDPPDPKDPSITIHKPHPDTALTPYKLMEIGRRLKRTYGWSEEDFFKST